tara:strand:- start:844 stop:1251 length:408 start_codon:yes stop_codon:yes gene_type:complete
LKKLFLTIIISFTGFASSNIEKDINISSDLIEYKKSSNSVLFKNNVEINSEYIVVSANEAIYDNEKDIISVYGNPSLIESSNPNSYFKGQAQKIIIYNDEKVHLIGEASMSYENINISSKKILFNPQTGNFKQQE